MRRTKDCQAIIICHGKSEMLLFSRLKSVLKIHIAIVGNENGKSSIKIQGIESYLNSQEFKEKKEFCDNFFQENYYDLRRQKQFQPLLNRLKVFVVMDVDDATDDEVNRYKNGEYFKIKWLKKRFVPIYNSPDLENTVSKIGYGTPETRHQKTAFYQRLWRRNIENENDVKELQEKLKECSSTNMEQVIQYLLNI